MDYKERYNEALSRATFYNNEWPTKEQRKMLVDIFPELKESEDEKTRKDIISYLRNEKIVKRYISDIEIDKWIAWLEKQKPNTRKREIDDAYLQGICDAKHEIEKQGKALDPDKVIGWLEDKQPSVGLIDKFKKDFGL